MNYVQRHKKYLIVIAIALLAYAGYEHLFRNGLKEVHMKDEPLEQPLPINTKPKILAIGSGFSVGVKQDGTVWTWGTNSHGILARPINKPEEGYEPGQVPNLTDVISVVASDHILVLKKDGTVWSWGNNDSGQLGYETEKKYTDTPKQIYDLNYIVDISVAWRTSFFVKKDGSVWAGGSNESGLLGQKDRYKKNSVRQIENLSDIKRVVGGSGVAGAIDKSGRLWTWGMVGEATGHPDALLSYEKNSYGGFDFSAERQQKIYNSPAFVRLPKKVVEASVSSAFIVLLEDGTVWTWGLGLRNDLGLGKKKVEVLIPERISVLSKVIGVASSFGGSIVTVDGLVAKWGGGITTPHKLNFTPRLPIMALTSSNDTYALVDGAGDVYYWQANGQGQRGTGVSIYQPSPQYWTAPEKSHWSFN